MPALPPILRIPLAVVAILSTAVVVSLGIRHAGETTAGPLDSSVQPWLSDTVAENRPLALAIDFAGEPVGLAALVLLLMMVALALRRPRMAMLVVLGTGLTITTTTLIKPVADRIIHHEHLSYPSGHTASATALAMLATMLAWHRLRPVAALVLLLVAALVVGAAAAWAQAGLVAHYPTDTLGGWCTALAVVPATAWLVDLAADRVTTVTGSL